MDIDWEEFKSRPRDPAIEAAVRRLFASAPRDIVPPTHAEIDAAVERGRRRAAALAEELKDRMHDMFAPRRLDPAGLVVPMPEDGFGPELPLEDEPFPIW